MYTAKNLASGHLALHANSFWVAAHSVRRSIKNSDPGSAARYLRHINQIVAWADNEHLERTAASTVNYFAAQIPTHQSEGGHAA